MGYRLACAIFLLFISVEAFSSERVTVHPAGVRSWAEMVAADAGLRATGALLDPAMIQPPDSSPSFANPMAVRNPSAERFSIGMDPRDSATLRSACSPCPGDAALTTGFLATTGTSSVPNQIGAVGPIHVMSMSLPEVRIQTRDGATISTVSPNTFWSVLGNGGAFPRLIFDQLSGRWIAETQIGGSPALAISSTSDPTGVWTYYLLPIESGELLSFHCLGVNTNWLAVTADVFSQSFSVFNGSKMWVVDKATAIAGGPLTVTIFPAGFDGNTTIGEASLQPCVTMDAAEQALWMINLMGTDPNDQVNLIRLSRITGSGAAPAWSVAPNSSYAGTGLFRVDDTFNFTKKVAANCGAQGLTLLGARIGASAVLRNGRIWATHHAWLPATGVPDRTSVFWYQIDPGAMPNPILQSGVIDSGAGTSHMCPSIAVNCADDVCIGMSRSDAVRCPEAAFATRLASDAYGTMRPVQTLRMSNRFFSTGFGTPFYWGYYSATVVDPDDDRGFWTIQQYVGPSYYIGSPFPEFLTKWGTWWGRISQDCNVNGIADLCDGVVNDCNSNGVSDFCECDHCDFNGDGTFNGADIRVFVETLVNQPSCAGAEFLAFCRADMNRDGLLSPADIPQFVQQMLSGVNCP